VSIRTKKELKSKEAKRTTQGPRRLKGEKKSRSRETTTTRRKRKKIRSPRSERIGLRGGERGKYQVGGGKMPLWQGVKIKADGGHPTERVIAGLVRFGETTNNHWGKQRGFWWGRIGRKRVEKSNFGR